MAAGKLRCVAVSGFGLWSWHRSIPNPGGLQRRVDERAGAVADRVHHPHKVVRNKKERSRSLRRRLGEVKGDAEDDKDTSQSKAPQNERSHGLRRWRVTCRQASWAHLQRHAICTIVHLPLLLLGADSKLLMTRVRLVEWSEWLVHMVGNND